MIFLDTGYLIALADARDRLHNRAIAWARVIREPRVVTEYVLLETLNYFSQVADRRRVHTLIDHLYSRSGYLIIESSSSLFRSGLEFHAARNDKSWSLTDCISFQVMTRMEIRSALAHDEHFEQAGFDALLRRDPPT